MLRATADDTPATILFWSYQAADHLSGAKVRQICRRALQDFPWIELLFPSFLHRMYCLSPYRLLTDRSSWIRKKFGVGNCYSCYYSHDVSADHTAQALMQAFPEARRICYGDPPGFLYPTRNTFLRNRVGRWNTLKELVWESRLRGIKNWFSPQESIIAVDFRSFDREGQPQTAYVLPNAVLLDTLERLRMDFPEITPKASSFFSALTDNECSPYLLLLSNFTASGMTSRQNELELYIDICQSYVPLGETICIKPHIGTPQKLLFLLLARLSDYRAFVFPVAAQQLPIELLPELIARSHVLSVSSSSALIAHLFKSDVTHVLTEDRIRHFFKPAYVAYMLKANKAIVEKASTARLGVVRGKTHCSMA